MFRPTGANASYFTFLCNRISAAGWRPDGPFPTGIFAEGIDFSETLMSNLPLNASDIRDSSFRGAQLLACSLIGADLGECSFAASQVFRCDFSLARLDRTDFAGSFLVSNRFNGASMLNARFEGAQAADNAFFTPRPGEKVPVPRNDFSDALGAPSTLIGQASGLSRE
jgi:uncharacterized protein YjbI with pentapeptide repeats